MEKWEKSDFEFIIVSAADNSLQKVSNDAELIEGKFTKFV